MVSVIDLSNVDKVNTTVNPYDVVKQQDFTVHCVSGK